MALDIAIYELCYISQITRGIELHKHCRFRLVEHFSKGILVLLSYAIKLW